MDSEHSHNTALFFGPGAKFSLQTEHMTLGTKF